MGDICIYSLSDLVNCQKNFQERLKNVLPKDIVTFDNVQESLKHNFFQEVELQEFNEANTIDEQREELIDVLLFMINKFIYLGIDLKDNDQSLLGTLWSFNSSSSFCTIESLARLEQISYISFIRKHCIFKPWKSRNNQNCVDGFSNEAFIYSLSYYCHMSNIIFDTFDEFYQCLISKMKINIERQNSNY